MPNSIELNTEKRGWYDGEDDGIFSAASGNHMSRFSASISIQWLV